MDNFHAPELRHATSLLADETDLAVFCIHWLVGGGEDIRKTPAHPRRPSALTRP